MAVKGSQIAADVSDHQRIASELSERTAAHIDGAARRSRHRHGFAGVDGEVQCCGGSGGGAEAEDRPSSGPAWYKREISFVRTSTCIIPYGTVTPK